MCYASRKLVFYRISDVFYYLTHPDYIYNKARQIAETTHQPIESVLLRQIEEAFLPKLPVTEQQELDALAHLSDDALWTISREQMSDHKQSRMQSLMQNNSIGSLNEVEQPIPSPIMRRNHQRNEYEQR